MECIFCKIIHGDIPNYTIYENNQVIAFLDIQPRAKGHTVVIPKVHTQTLLDLHDEIVRIFFISVKKAMEKINYILHPDGFSVGWNHGKAGGQVVLHLHVHILPRWDTDGGGNIHSIINNPGEQSVEEIARLFV